MFSVGRHSTVRPGVNRALVVVGVLVMLAIVAATAELIASRRSEALEDSQRATAEMAQVLAEQTSRSMQTVDLTLREIAGQLAATAAQTGEPLSAVMDSPATFDMLVEQMKGLPQASVLSIIGPDGRLRNTSRQFPAPQRDSSDRDYFRYFAGSDDHGDFVGAPAKSHLSDEWMTFLARRINDTHGRFAGVVVAAISLSQLEDFYRVAMPADGAVTVLRRDGMILVHFPHVEAQIGLKLSFRSPWYQVADQGGGSFLSPGYVDGIASLVSVRPLRDFALVIDVSQTEAAALAGWQRRALWLLAGAGLSAAVAIVLLWAFDDQLYRLKRSEVSLARQNAELEDNRLQFDAALDNISQGLTFFDGDQTLIVCNRRYRELYGVPPELARAGTSLRDIVAFRAGIGSLPDLTPDEYMARRAVLSRPGEPFEVVDQLLDGRFVSLRYQPLPNHAWVTTHEDITERRLAEADLAFLARHDALTLLPNRTLFQEQLEQALAATPRQGGCGLLLLDLDGLKVVNDNLGHRIGDALLQAVAGRLRSVIREVDTVARLGGDEFAIIQCGLESPQDVAVLGEQVIASVGEPFDIDGHRVLVGASIGAAMALSDAMSRETLLRNADIALYLAKGDGRGTYRVFDPQMDARVQVRRALELDLRDALANQAFELEYQPVVELRTGKAVGFEALIRWNHPLRGVISPGDFIPIAEDTGLIVAIGKWVLRQACLEATTWPGDIGIAVNLSAIQFRGGGLFDTVAAALAESGLAPTRLELEITESVLMHHSDERLATLHRLRALGVRVALDDFGTGYSSLGYLRSFPFDKIKIDRCFVCDLVSNRESKVIVSAIIGLAVGLGMTVTAEGVESADQLAVLRDEGCALVQGDLFSPPLPADETMDWIRAPAPPAPAARQPVGSETL